MKKKGEGRLKRRVSPREAKRMMQRMGLNMGEVPDAQEVIIKTGSKEIIIENPSVAIVEMQGQKIFQITGEKIIEKAATTTTMEKKPTIPDEDVQLVAQQAKVSVEQARAALEQTNGDLAQAILLLSQR
jgi:nascent polypeptide-associated complex subunit alpha